MLAAANFSLRICRSLALSVGKASMIVDALPYKALAATICVRICSAFTAPTLDLASKTVACFPLLLTRSRSVMEPLHSEHITCTSR